jgi:dTDP-4-amino-4,6-dideoxygalactose transaminase
MRGILIGDFPVADELHGTELSLPISVGHTPLEVQTVCRSLRRFK